jgi:hypothetical protein
VEWFTAVEKSEGGLYGHFYGLKIFAFKTAQFCATTRASKNA